MEAIVVLTIILICVLFIKRTFSGFIYAFAIVDIFLRIMSFIKGNINIKDISSLIGKYLPESIPSIINKYTNDLFNSILMWVYVVLMGIFLFHIIKIFIKKK